MCVCKISRYIIDNVNIFKLKNSFMLKSKQVFVWFFFIKLACKLFFLLNGSMQIMIALNLYFILLINKKSIQIEYFVYLGGKELKGIKNLII